MAMTIEDYMHETRKDALAYVEENYEHFSDFTELWDECLLCRTGNCNGSYTFNAWQAAHNVAWIIWDECFINELLNFAYEGVPFEKGAEAIDVIARFIYMGYAYSECEALFVELTEEDEED